MRNGSYARCPRIRRRVWLATQVAKRRIYYLATWFRCNRSHRIMGFPVFQAKASELSCAEGTGVVRRQGVRSIEVVTRFK